MSSCKTKNLLRNPFPTLIYNFIGLKSFPLKVRKGFSWFKLDIWGSSINNKNAITLYLSFLQIITSKFKMVPESLLATAAADFPTTFWPKIFSQIFQRLFSNQMYSTLSQLYIQCFYGSMYQHTFSVIFLSVFFQSFSNKLSCQFSWTWLGFNFFLNSYHGSH